MGMDIFIVVVLLLLGIFLILAEIFLLPGVTLAIVAGIAFSAGGIYYSYSQLGFMAGNITVVSSVVLFGVIFFWLLKSKALDKIALKTDIKSTVADKESLNIKEGDEGITLSRMNPIGKVRVNDVTMEAKTLGDFLDEDQEIVVLKVFPTQLIVQQKSTEE